MMGEEKHKYILVSAKNNVQKPRELHCFLSQIKLQHSRIFTGFQVSLQMRNSSNSKHQ